MRVSRLKVSFIIFCLITLPTFVLAQKTWLEQYSIDKANQWQKNRLIAESIATKLNMPIRLEYEDGTTMELQRFENTRPVYYITDNIRSAKTISTNKVWPGGSTGYALTGSTETLGEWDGGGVRTTHQEFGGRVIQSQGTSNQHSTHVAGTIMAAGLDTNAKGMAYQALLKEYDWNNDESEMAAAANAGLRISNHSYGTINGWYFDYFNDAKWAWFGDTTISNDEDYSFGYYDADAQSWDNISYNAPYYLIVNSAGNDRGDGPGSSVQHWVNVNGNWSLVTRYRPYDGGPNGKYDCISGTSLAKNVLSVGSIKDLTSGYTTPPFVQMESYSGWGPTDDGRIKPDIVANGQSVYSASNSSNTVYANLSGTSMASPAVTGSIGLLLEQQRRMHGTTPLLSSTLKAIVINSADEAGPNPGPDYEYGWGLLNTPRSVQTMKLDSIDGYESHILERMLYEDSVITIQVASNGTSPLRATICWTDPSSSPLAPSLDNPITMLKNDIDLRITKNTSGSVSYPWILDGANPTTAATVGDNIRDNVEQIYIASPSKGLYTLTINHKGVLTNDSQRVSIVVTGNSHIGPFAYFQSDTVTVSILPNDSSIVTYRLYNNGDDTLEYSANVVTTSWLTLSNENNGIISDDSEFIQLNVNTMNLSQWSTYNSSFTITTNDPTQPTKNVYVVLTTLGPLISAPPSSIVIEAETTEVKFDTLTLSNNGYSDLNYLITSNSSLMKNNGATFPSWLTLSSDNGTLTPNESLDVILTFDATAQAIGNYSTTLSFSSNDSLTGTRTTTLDFHVATRRTLSFAVGTRWNIVSLPLTTFTFSKTALFPSASSEAFLYNAG
ncbi:MAG: S8 family serine peptidase, partial [Ignavibacteriae bacterium]|nr:S8 family serine peptidase [Ignavibacteriota bacterium]